MDQTVKTRELAKQYDPFSVESKWATRWADEPFTADPRSDKPPFCIVIPPPNVNGNLHLGHAFDNTIIDTLIRFKRMQGFEALYQPGTDHAGITTQVEVEKHLASEGRSRRQLGREGFLDRVWRWKDEYGDIILRQLQRLGISADWTRSRFTMDEGLSRAVRKQFVDLYHRGLIYRGERIVHWDPASQTTLSDLEVDREDRPGKLYTLAYELEGGGHIAIATARPETIFADVAVAVHPEDERHNHLIGRQARIPLTDRFIGVIADEAVEREFGSGALKITPAHDPLDFEIGERHGLPRPQVIGLDAKLVSELVPEPFRGLDRFEARQRVVEALAATGELLDTRDHTVAMGFSQRTREPVEPILSLQWFYDVEPIARRVLEALDRGEMLIHPSRYAKVNRDWLENIRPWCISRQLWWGHQIPAWYDQDGNCYVPSPDDPYTDCPDAAEYAGLDLRQDPDVFDTWFSSNLWPFSTLGWPDESDPYYRKFYPTSVLVTGYDILFFWVARMQMAGFELTGRTPFAHVLLHGLVLDAQGQKMSKSRGNGIDPLDVIDLRGADALRFAMTYASTGGQDIRWDDRRVEMGRNFNNKLWNAARFAFMHFEGGRQSVASAGAARSPNLADRWIASRLHRAIGTITEHLEAFDLGAANRAAYDFVWSEFCDWYLEAVKPQLKHGERHARATLESTLTTVLKLLHPMLPFITSEIYEALGHKRQLGEESWPAFDERLLDEDAEAQFNTLMQAVTAVRDLRAQAQLPPSQLIDVTAEGSSRAVIDANQGVFESLARVRLGSAASGASLTQRVPGLELTLPLKGLIDIEAWRARQEKRLVELKKQLDRSERKLADPKFIAGAPAQVVDEERRRAQEAGEVIRGIEQSLASL